MLHFRQVYLNKNMYNGKSSKFARVCIWLHDSTRQQNYSRTKYYNILNAVLNNSNNIFWKFYLSCVFDHKIFPNKQQWHYFLDQESFLPPIRPMESILFTGDHENQPIKSFVS